MCGSSSPFVGMAADAEEYALEPAFDKRFKESAVKEVLSAALRNKLEGNQYNAEFTSQWAREIADDAKHRLKGPPIGCIKFQTLVSHILPSSMGNCSPPLTVAEMELDRYKFVVQCVIGEQKGEGVNMGTRCFWDPSTDKCVSEYFINETMFAVAVAFGAYVY